MKFLKGCAGFFVFGSVLCASFFSLSCRQDDDTVLEEDVEPQVISIGALCSLTGGSWNSLGTTTAAALAIAQDDVNAYAASINSPFAFEAVVLDTQLDTSLVAEKFGELSLYDANAFIGPQSGAEMEAIIPYLDTTSNLIISTTASSASFSSPGLNIYSFCFDDGETAKAITVLLKSDGVSAIIPVVRNDPDNSSLINLVASTFEASGGSALSSIGYSSISMNPQSVVQSLKSSLTAAIAAFGTGHVGIFLAGYDETSQILGIASTDSLLGSVHWYGGEGSALNLSVTANDSIAQFAAKVHFSCPAFGYDNAASYKWQAVANEIKSKTGIYPTANALAAYDAFWVTALAYLSINGSTDISSMKSAFVGTAGNYYGTTGRTLLNNAGTRQFGYTDFWGITKTSTTFGWTQVASFDPSSSTLTRQ